MGSILSLILLSLLITACGGGGSSEAANTAPTITSQNTVDIAEGQTFVLDVLTRDAEGDPVSFSLSGTDANLFSFTENKLSFTVAPDFAAPGSAVGTNVYTITVVVSDGASSTSQVLTITVLQDTDSDGTANIIDNDDDNDGVEDISDAFPLDSSESLDTDSDGIGNNADIDDDNDGTADSADAFPLDSSETLDTDSDGIGNNTDTDDDNDGVNDAGDPAPLNASLTPPTAVIEAETSSGNAPLRVAFNASASVAGNPQDSSDVITSMSWSSGDGSSGSGSLFEHIYLAAGEYSVSLTVTNSDGYSDQVTYPLTVTAVEGILTVNGAISIPSPYVADSDVNDQGTVAISNNTYGLSQAIPRTAVVSGYANRPGSGEEGLSSVEGDISDIYRINAMGGEVINLISGDTTNGDLDLYVENSSFTYSDFSVGDRTLYESITLPNDPGTYFIEVYTFSGASTYILEIGGHSTRASHGWNANAKLVENELIVKESPKYAASEILQTQRTMGVSRVVQPKSSGYRGPGLFRLNPVAARAISSKTAQPAQRPSESARAINKHETLRKAKEMRSLKHFKYVEPNFRFKATAVPNDPAYPFQAWHYEQINMPDAWDRATGSRNVKVAVLDTGIMLDHPDLVNRVTSDGYDFVSILADSGDGDGVDSDPSDPGDGQDNSLCPDSFYPVSSFHGTHVAGTVGAQTNDRSGVAGVNWNVEIMPIRVLGCTGGTDYDIVQGILYAAGLENDYGVLPDTPADIINLSLGGPYQNIFSQNAVDAAREAGVIVIAAAGNDGDQENLVNYPAAYAGVVSVAATNPEGRRAVYSTFNSEVDVAAPGGSGTGDSMVVSAHAKIDDGAIVPQIYETAGTSMAAPHIAGVASLMKEIYPSLTPEDFDSALALGIMTVDVGTSGKDVEYGYGLIDANKALQTAEGLTSGALTDFPPVLRLTTNEVDLGFTGTEVTVQAINAGGGDLTVTQVTTSSNNISVLSQADANGLGEYVITVNRAGLNEGVYQGSVDFSSTAGTDSLMLNYEVLASSAGDPDGGRLYVLLYNVNTEEVESQVSSVASAGQYSFAFDEVQPAVYVLVAGSDIDNDGFICGAGEACALWPNLQEPDYLIANQSFVDISMALRFETPILIDSSRVFSVAGETTKLPRQEACKSELAIDYLVGRKREGCADQMLQRGY